MHFYVVVNDLIGGWDVTNADKPVSQLDEENGEVSFAWGLSEEFAVRITNLLNGEYYRINPKVASNPNMEPVIDEALLVMERMD